MLGGQVVTELLSRGKRVRALVRPTSDATRLQQVGVEVARGDMMDPASLLQAMDGADTVISTAAVYTRHSKGDTDKTTSSAIGTSQRRPAGGTKIRLDQHLTCDQTRDPTSGTRNCRGPSEELGSFVSLRRRVPRHDRQDGWRPIRQAPADVVRISDDPTHLRAHPGLGRLSG
jgi:hypothetical protein